MKTVLKRSLVLFLICGQILLPLHNLSAFSGQQETVRQILDLAESNYFNGKFDKAIENIKQCLVMGITADERFRAYKILAQAYLAKDYRRPAREVVKKMLEAAPDYYPTLEEEPPDFIDMVNEVRQQKSSPVQLPQENDYTWLYISAGTVAAAGVVLLIFSGSTSDDKPKTLANPPAWPEEQ